MAEVLGRYSNLCATGVTVRPVWERALVEVRSEPWKEPELRGVTRVRRMLSGQVDAMVADYQAGMGSYSLARKYGVSDNTVLVRLKAAGVEIRPPGKLSAADVVEVGQLRSEGWTQQRIADRFGVTRAAVSLRLSRLSE